METYTNLNSVEDEKINSMKEGVISLPNQNVVDKLSEDAAGNLLYDGKPISSERKTTVMQLVSNEWYAVYSNDGNGVIVYLVNDITLLKEGTEIKSINIYLNNSDLNPYGDTVPVETLSAIDGYSYVASYKKVISSLISRDLQLVNIFTPQEPTPLLSEIVNHDAIIDVEYYI